MAIAFNCCIFKRAPSSEIDWATMTWGVSFSRLLITTPYLLLCLPAEVSVLQNVTSVQSYDLWVGGERRIVSEKSA